MDSQWSVGRIYEGNLIATELRFGIVCSRFNEFFTKNLLEEAIHTIIQHGGTKEKIEVVWVPGSYEVPFMVHQLAKTGCYDAILALGIVIQGSTSHADYINSYVANSLGSISRETGIPVIYGVVTCENLEQAIERSGTKLGNRGASAAVCAIEMANLTKEFKKRSS